MIKSIIAVIRQRRWKAKKKVVAKDVCAKYPQTFKMPKGLVVCRVDYVNIIKSTYKLNLQVDVYMKIIHIFAGKIYSFQFDNETENELRRNMNLWNNEQYIHQFLKENQNDIPGNSTNERIAKLIHEDSYELSASLYQVATDDNHLKLYLSNLTTRNINTHYCHHEKQGETI